MKLADGFGEPVDLKMLRHLVFQQTNCDLMPET